MALPKITTPLIPITLPTTGEELTVRQFLLKEYKVIMTAINSKNVGVFVKTVSDVVNSCIVEPKNFDISKYHSYEIDYIFLQLYTVSVSGVIDVSVTCNNLVEKPVIEIDELGFERESGETETTECGCVYNLEIKSSDVKISDIHDGVFKIDDNIILKLKYPDWEMWHQVASDLDIDISDITKDSTSNNYTDDDYQRNQEEVSRILFKCVDEIWQGDDKWEDDYTFEEFNGWLDTFPPDALEGIIGFIQNIPQLYYRQDVVCPSCGNKGTINMVGLESFLK